MNLKRQQACRALMAGKLLAYPTEAVYGLGCLASDEQALKKLRQVKKRAAHKGFIVLVHSLEQLQHHFPQLKLTPAQIETLRSPQAHPTTWVIPVSTGFSVHQTLLLGSNRSLAIRISEHPTVQALCQKAGPLVSTSANKAGERPAQDMLRLRKTFGKRIDFYLNEKTGNAKSPSQIIDLASGEILRSA